MVSHPPFILEASGDTRNDVAHFAGRFHTRSPLAERAEGQTRQNCKYTHSCTHCMPTKTRGRDSHTRVKADLIHTQTPSFQKADR